MGKSDCFISYWYRGAAKQWLVGTKILQLAGILLLVGCASSSYPLSDARDSQPDPELLGFWELFDAESELVYSLVIEHRWEDSKVLLVKPKGVRSLEENDRSLIAMIDDGKVSEDSKDLQKKFAEKSPSEAKVISELVASEIRELEKAEWIELYCTRMGEKKYLSLRQVSREDSGQTPPAFLIFRYELVRDGIKFEGLDLNVVRKLIADGKLKGSLGRGVIKTAGITETPEDLRSWLLADGDRLFSAPQIIPMKRIAEIKDVSVGR
jgi:hypothetical protein